MSIGALAAIVVSSPSSAEPPARQETDAKRTLARKSTDPPLPSRGKFGQDLFLALDHRDIGQVKALLANGADPNSTNGLEFTPLYIAAASHQNDAVRLLLDAGAKADFETIYGTPLTFAAATNNVLGAKTLIEHGANVNTARTDGITVLMMAANSGSTEIATELIKRNANVLSTNANGSTALIYAARGGNEAIGSLILDSGVDANKANSDKETPLMAAAVRGHAGFVRLLLKNGADPNARDGSGATALTLSAKYGDYPAVATALLGGGADAKVRDGAGLTAADYAVQRGHLGVAKALGRQVTSIPAAKQSPRQAVEKGVKLMQSSMRAFNERTTCVSCHQEGLGRMATAVAREHGLSVDEPTQRAIGGRLDMVLGFTKGMHDKALKDPEAMKQLPLIEMNEVSVGYSWLLAGMAASGRKADDAAASMAMVVAKQQSPDGSWTFSLPRVPMQSSVFTVTALAVRSLNAFAPKSAAGETAGRIDKARSWLSQAPAKTGDDRAFRLLGLKWSSAGAKDLKKAAAEIVKAQRPDGGWAQEPGMPSDANATGQALYALASAGATSVNDPVYKRGVQFLLRTQDADGSWFVSKRALPANNYMDAGFPHGESQYASFNATCWATMALMQTLPKSKA